jgi:triosephosphate isomerase
MRIPMIAGNWKMNTTIAEAVDLVYGMAEGLEAIHGVEIVVCPPFVSLFPVYEILRGSSVKLGAQNAEHRLSGAFTGEVSPLMLAPICHYVILGHSERRQYYGDTDESVNAKVKAALGLKLWPIVCVGESLEERDSGRTEEVVGRQVRAAFAGIETFGDTVIAYEPVWAIGTGRAATAEQANETVGFIRAEIGRMYGPRSAADMRILYGGSMNAANAASLLEQPEIDGGLIGGASLKAADFAAICAAAREAKVPEELRRR